jgi:hypothetical protein
MRMTEGKNVLRTVMTFVPVLAAMLLPMAVQEHDPNSIAETYLKQGAVQSDTITDRTFDLCLARMPGALVFGASRRNA